MRSDAATCRASSPDARSGASCSPNPAPAPTSLASRPGRFPWRAAGSSTARRSGRRSPTAPTSASCSPAPIPTAAKHDGLSMLIVDLRAPGVEVRPIRQLDGAMHFDEVFLTDVFVPSDSVLPPAGAGWRIASAMLHHQRIARATGQRGGVRHDRTDRLLDEVRRRELTDPVVRDAARAPVHRRGLPEPARLEIAGEPPRRTVPIPVRSVRSASSRTPSSLGSSPTWRGGSWAPTPWHGTDRHWANPARSNRERNGQPTRCSRCRCPSPAAPTRSSVRSSQNACSDSLVSPPPRNPPAQ